MKSRLKKKIEKREREKVHAILEMVLRINGAGCRLRDKTGDLPTAFFNFSGHVSNVYVRVYESGWGPNGESNDVEYHIGEEHSPYYESFDSCMKRLREIEKAVSKHDVSL